jgi:lipoate-protein ligase A
MVDPPPHTEARTAASWRVEEVRGPAQVLHDLGVPSERLVRVNEVEAPVVVLGSAQGPEVLDDRAAQAVGAGVARRRSGGGAVWLAPGVQVWLDLVVPAGDPLWRDDVVQAAGWVGELWRAALQALVPTADFGVHRGTPVRREEGRLACFAGLSAGEVSVLGAGGVEHKVVGVSQRRTRDAARFQTVTYLRWDPEPLLLCLGPSTAGGVGAGVASALRHEVAAVPVPVGATGGPDGRTILEAVLDALPR